MTFKFHPVTSIFVWVCVFNASDVVKCDSPSGMQTPAQLGTSASPKSRAKDFRKVLCLNPQELLSDRRMPDVRQYISTQRLRTLKRQVEQLMNHETKLKADIDEMELRLVEKKQRFDKCREEFEEKWRGLCSEKPKVSKVRRFRGSTQVSV